jgi:MFS transporter, PAT family, beta-lactamase induction signal transducer AmpG
LTSQPETLVAKTAPLSRWPQLYVPTLYFAQGLPYTLVNLVSAVFFKNLGASNEFIGLTSFLSLPWVLKPLWGPFIDSYGSRRSWILWMQAGLAIITGLTAAAMATPFALPLALAFFVAMGLASATHDIAMDGYYLDALDQDQQALYTGVRVAAYKMAVLFGTGGLVYFAGALGEQTSVSMGWSLVFGGTAALMLGLSAFHSWGLPRPLTKKVTPGLGNFVEAFRTYFSQPAIAVIVLYIVTFRLGDALMLKMAQPFLLDTAAKGGLAIATKDVGIIYGTYGVAFLLIGGVVGGWLVARYGIKKCIFPTALFQNGAILLYWWLSVAKPPLWEVGVVNAIEQFAYGLGTAAYTVFLMRTVRPDSEYKGAHYAIATGLMALGLLLPGAVSGYLETALGYSNFFFVSFLVAIPGLITIFFLPVSIMNEPEKNPPVSPHS